jgi:hypothetical protein
MNIKQNILITSLALMLTFGFNIVKLEAQETKDAEFKPSGNFWGYVFGDYAYKTHNDTLQRGGGNVQYKTTNSLNANNTTANTLVPANVQTNAFQLRRVYLGYDYQFAKNLSASVVLAHEQTVIPGSNQNTVYLKYANVKWSNIFKNSDLVIGQYSTCSFATAGNTEPLWGYRAIERTIMDMHNTDGSSDLGLSLQGKAWSQQGPDSLKPMFIGYALQVGNGSSATPETDIFKKFRGNVYVSFLKQQLIIGLYGDYVTQQFSPYHTSNMTFKAYASYKTERFRIGAEVFQQTNQNSDMYKVAVVTNGVASTAGVIADTASGVQMGFSVFASGAIIKNKLNIFARYDMYNPNTKWNTNNVYSGVSSAIKGSDLNAATFYKQTFITAGLDWTPNSRMHIMPNVWYNGYKTMMSTTGAGGTGSDLTARVKKDNDLVYRLTFYFIFNGSKKVANNGMNY